MARPPVVGPRQPPWREIDPVAVGRRIRETRLDAGLSQRQLAFPGCSAAYISRLEAGERVPSGHLLVEMASRLSTSAAYLATGKPAPDPHAIVAALEEAVRYAVAARAWVAVPHEQWRNLISAAQIGPDVQPVPPADRQVPS